jgi:hypothetical protein
LKAETDPAERTRLRMEMAAQQQSCRELAADYNANSLQAEPAAVQGSRPARPRVATRPPAKPPEGEATMNRINHHRRRRRL